MQAPACFTLRTDELKHASTKLAVVQNDSVTIVIEARHAGNEAREIISNAELLWCISLDKAANAIYANPLEAIMMHFMFCIRHK